MYVLPEDLRDLLKTRIGKLFVNEKKLIDKLSNKKNIVSIGDIVTYTILKHNIKPLFCVVDFHTKRGRCADEIIDTIYAFGENRIEIDNPKGTITDELWDAIKHAYKNVNKISLRIEVRGEEDLASLAAIYLAPPDVTIIYGLPDKGVLVVKPTEKNKNTVKEVLDKM